MFQRLLNKDRTQNGETCDSGLYDITSHQHDSTVHSSNHSVACTTFVERSGSKWPTWWRYRRAPGRSGVTVPAISATASLSCRNVVSCIERYTSITFTRCRYRLYMRAQFFPRCACLHWNLEDAAKSNGSKWFLLSVASQRVETIGLQLYYTHVFQSYKTGQYLHSKQELSDGGVYQVYIPSQNQYK